jgi:hypothetical protein
MSSVRIFLLSMSYLQNLYALHVPLKHAGALI